MGLYMYNYSIFIFVNKQRLHTQKTPHKQSPNSILDVVLSDTEVLQ